MKSSHKTATIFWTAILTAASTARCEEPAVAFQQADDRLHITIGGEPFVDYVWSDEKILRPYFAHVHASGGVQVTRNHPPDPQKEAADHDTMHPGLWLAFGDINGADFWRNKGRVVHEKFVQPPISGPGRGAFLVRNNYLPAGSDTPILNEVCHCVIRVRPHGVLLRIDSALQANGGEVIFGDQEEMGLGVRLATPLTVKSGGHITNSDGKTNEAEVWGQQADWCDYSGVIEGRRAGVVIMPHPNNFRRSWFHARDYGLLVANPFGRKAFTRGEPSRVAVEPGKSLRLRFGVFIYRGPSDAPLDIAAVYDDYLSMMGKASP